MSESSINRRRQLNRRRRRHDRVIRRTALALGGFALGLIGLGVMVYVAPSPDLQMHRAQWQVTFGALLGGGLLYGALGARTARNSFGALATGYIIAVLGLIVSIVAEHAWAAGAHALVAAVLTRGVMSLRAVDHHIEDADLEDPVSRYYHSLVVLLAQVMRSDGHVDRREMQQLHRVCADTPLSSYELHRLIQHAVGTERAVDVDAVIRRHLAAASEVGVGDAPMVLLAAALTVSTADGVVTHEEMATIRALGERLGVGADEVEALIRAARGALEHPSIELARDLLRVGAEADEASLRRAHAQMIEQLQRVDAHHIGAPIGRYVDQQLLALDRALETLLAAPDDAPITSRA